jgi:hypothetical protein
MKKSNSIMGVTFLIAVGIGLGLLRLFVNSSIKKMKGKGWKSKVLFFGVLLGLGLPFQSWFRNNVLLTIDYNGCRCLVYDNLLWLYYE